MDKAKALSLTQKLWEAWLNAINQEYIEEVIETTEATKRNALWNQMTPEQHAEIIKGYQERFKTEDKALLDIGTYINQLELELKAT